MAATNVPAPSFTPVGFQASSISAILAGVQADWQSAYNVTLNFALTTPQGQITSSEAAIIQNAQQTFAFLAAMTDPAYAQGRFQDAIGRIYGLSRLPAIPTTLIVNCTGGGAGAPIVLPGGAGGATITDASGNIYGLVTSITLPAGGGTVTGTFTCTVPGPIAVPSGPTPISIFQSIPGWDAVTLVSGVQGTNVEGRAAFEERRQDSVEANSLGAVGSIIGQVAQVAGVVDYFGFSNNGSTSTTAGGVVVPPNAVFISVAGGGSGAVASAIFSKKGPGAPTFGNNTVTVFDNNPLYAAPIAYTINYQIPTALQLIFKVTLVRSGAIPSNGTQLVQNAILAAVQQGVISPAAVFTGSISGNVLTVSNVTQGAIAVGQVLADTTNMLALNTQVTGFLSGAGGVGTYSVSLSQTVPSETMSALAGNSQVQTNLRARIAQTLYATNYVQAVSALGPWAQVASINIGSPNVTDAVFTGSISGSTLTVTAIISGSIAVGQTLFGSALGTNVILGTQIAAFSSGAGGTGTYLLSTPQTLGSTTLVTASADQTSVAVLATQVPQITALNISVNTT